MISEPIQVGRIDLTRGEETILDVIDFDRLGGHKWFCVPTPCGLKYAGRRIRINGKQITRYLHREIMNNPKGKEIDHINGNGLDNRKQNLRECSHLQNVRNSKMNKNNKSGYRGVCFHKNKKLWIASISVKWKRIHLGYYDQKIDAINAYKLASKKYFGEFERQ